MPRHRAPASNPASTGRACSDEPNRAAKSCRTRNRRRRNPPSPKSPREVFRDSRGPPTPKASRITGTIKRNPTHPRRSKNRLSRVDVESIIPNRIARPGTIRYRYSVPAPPSTSKAIRARISTPLMRQVSSKSKVWVWWFPARALPSMR